MTKCCFSFLLSRTYSASIFYFSKDSHKNSTQSSELLSFNGKPVPVQISKRFYSLRRTTLQSNDDDHSSMTEKENPVHKNNSYSSSQWINVCGATGALLLGLVYVYTQKSKYSPLLGNFYLEMLKRTLI